MEPGRAQGNYLRYIGAGAVAAGGIISMFRALPLIFGSIVAGLRDLRASGRRRPAADVAHRARPADDRRDLRQPRPGRRPGARSRSSASGLSLQGILGALMILLFGFLFVTVSSRLTGEVGSSSNPISGMTIATLLLTCLIFVLLGRTATRRRC